MSAVEFVYSENPLDPECIHLFEQKEATIGILDAFLDKLIVGEWASQGSKETELISPHTDKAFCFHLRSKSRFLAADAAPNVVVDVESPSHASPVDSDIPWTRSTASPETGVKSSSRTNRKTAVVDATGTPSTSVGNAILSYSSVCKLSSTTYLRRMHLSRKDAIAFFPESKETIEFIFATDMTRCASSEQFKVEISVSLQDGEGRRWPVVLECLRSAGQRHLRLNKGWSEMCRVNGICVGKRIRLARWEQTSSSNDPFVTVSIM